MSCFVTERIHFRCSLSFFFFFFVLSLSLSVCFSVSSQQRAALNFFSVVFPVHYCCLRVCCCFLLLLLHYTVWTSLVFTCCLPPCFFSRFHQHPLFVHSLPRLLCALLRLLSLLLLRVEQDMIIHTQRAKKKHEKRNYKTKHKSPRQSACEQRELYLRSVPEAVDFSEHCFAQYGRLAQFRIHLSLRYLRQHRLIGLQQHITILQLQQHEDSKQQTE